MSIDLAEFHKHIADVTAARGYHEAAATALSRVGVDCQSATLTVTHADGKVIMLASGVRDGEIYDWADVYEPRS